MDDIKVGDVAVYCNRMRNGSVRKQTRGTKGKVLGRVNYINTMSGEVQIIPFNAGDPFYRTVSNYIKPKAPQQVMGGDFQHGRTHKQDFDNSESTL